MKPKTKSILSIIGLVVVSLLFSISIFVISVLLIFYLSFKGSSEYLDSAELSRLEGEKWALEKQIEYKDYICEIESKLPNENSQSIYVEILNYEKKIPITTDINPYPQLSSISEVGVVQSSTPVSIRAESKKIRVYRIELLSNPDIYIEYISHKDEPYLYILKDSNSSEFLLYPIITKQLVPIDTDHYIIDTSTIEK